MVVAREIIHARPTVVRGRELDDAQRREAQRRAVVRLEPRRFVKGLDHSDDDGGRAGVQREGIVVRTCAIGASIRGGVAWRFYRGGVAGPTEASIAWRQRTSRRSDRRSDENASPGRRRSRRADGGGVYGVFPRILAPELGVATANTKSVKSII